MAGFEAGAAVADITGPVGATLGGYGGRTHGATGIHDKLYARALVLGDGDAQLALVICDLVGVSRALVEQARALIAAECGIPAENVCIAATHTHDGPIEPLLPSGGAYIADTARKIAGAVQVARAALRPVTLKLGTAAVTTISQNRRHPDGPVDETAKVLLAAPPAGDGGPPVATLVNYACHATVLERDNYLYTADFPGAVASFLERTVGGGGIFMQGAAGDINPVWMRHDFTEMERVGNILGAAAARTAFELQPLGEGQWAVNLSWSEETPKRPALGTVLTPAQLRGARAFVDLPRRVIPPEAEIEREVGELEAQIAALPEGDDERRRLNPRLVELRVYLTRLRQFAGEPGLTRQVEVQALRIADECAVVALPGEFLIEIGRELEERAGVPHLLICGYANDYISYVPAAHHFPEGGYEVGCALFEPEAAGLIIQAALDLVRSLYP